MNEIDAILESLKHCLKLSPTRRLVNYTVSLRHYCVPRASSPEETIRAALGPAAVVGGLDGGGSLWGHEEADSDVAAHIENCLRWRGEEGSQPDPAVLDSDEFNQLVEKLVAFVRREMSTATAVHAFWLRQGHPFYPVYWDFAVLFEHARDATILIGSSSD